MALFWGQKAGQKWPVVPKNRGILVTCRLHRFICPKFALTSSQYRIFRHGAGPAAIFYSKELTFKLSLSDYETVAKVL